MERLRSEDSKPDERPKPAPAPPPPQPHDLLDLQRGAGNAAVARMLMREPAPAAPGSLNLHLTSGLMDDYYAATDLVNSWFDSVTQASTAASVMSVAELVAAARELPVKTKSGATKPVSEVVVQAADIERVIRTRAKARGIKLLEHRAVDDPKGVESEALATLKNLGVDIPDSVSFGGDDAKITIGIGGTVKGSVKAGKAEIEAEASAEGGSASVKAPGVKVGASVDDKGFKLDVKAGDLVTVKGSVARSGDDWEWKADLQIGTLGKVVTPAEIAKVMQGAQDTFGNSARDLAAGVTPEKVKEHGAAVHEAVQGVVDKAKKSAEQAKSGWQVGVGVQGGGQDGGFAATVTVTWVF